MYGRDHLYVRQNHGCPKVERYVKVYLLIFALTFTALEVLLYY